MGYTIRSIPNSTDRKQSWCIDIAGALRVVKNDPGKAIGPCTEAPPDCYKNRKLDRWPSSKWQELSKVLQTLPKSHNRGCSKQPRYKGDKFGNMEVKWSMYSPYNGLEYIMGWNNANNLSTIPVKGDANGQRDNESLRIVSIFSIVSTASRLSMALALDCRSHSLNQKSWTALKVSSVPMTGDSKNQWQMACKWPKMSIWITSHMDSWWAWILIGYCRYCSICRSSERFSAPPADLSPGA